MPEYAKDVVIAILGSSVGLAGLLLDSWIKDLKQEYFNI